VFAPLMPIAFLPLLTAARAYSIWRSLPDGLKVVRLKLRNAAERGRGKRQSPRKHVHVRNVFVLRAAAAARAPRAGGRPVKQTCRNSRPLCSN
jgi:hypothetical protein